MHRLTDAMHTAGRMYRHTVFSDMCFRFQSSPPIQHAFFVGCAGIVSFCQVSDFIHGVSKKVYPLMFDNDFGNCGPIFKILSPIDSKGNSLIHPKDFHLTCSLSLQYLVKFENRKMLPNFHVKCNS